MWRQGDVLIAAIPSLPVSKGRRSKNLALASGDATGHRHRIKDRRSARLYVTSSEMFLEALADEAILVHPEHNDITLPHGCYRVWRQQEYSERGRSTIAD